MMRATAPAHHTAPKATHVLVTVLVLTTLLLASMAAPAATLNVPSGPYPTIQSAIDAAAASGDTIQVAAGTYYENLTWSTKSIQLIGAGAGVSIVNGNATASCLRMTSVPSSASVQGFTFTNGNATGAWPACDGGGIRCDNSSPTISSNVISGNASSNSGGGICCYHSSPAITGNTISGNTGIGGAGGIQCHYSSPPITGNTISGNTAEIAGGIYCVHSSSAITGNTITGNTASVYYGGGIDCHYASTTITGNTISGNAAPIGGGIWCYNSSVAVRNTIIAFSVSGGGIHVADGSPPALSYCDVYGNAGGDYTNIPDQTGINGNISMDPLFANTAGEDYHLQSTGGRWDGSTWVLDGVHSPCIDAGDPGSAFANEPMDNGGRVNMGRWGNTAEASKTGLPPGPPSVVWVDDDWTGPTNCGGHIWLHDAFATIQEGINGVTSPGTVIVAAGTYQSYAILKSDLAIEGAGTGATIVGPGPSSHGAHVNGAKGIVITGMTFRGLPYQGVNVVGGAECTLRHVACESNKGFGGNCNASTLTASDCTFSGSTYNGFRCYSGAVCDFERVSFSHNARDGIDVALGGIVTATDCSFDENAFRGLLVYADGSATCRSCQFTGNSQHGARAVGAAALLTMSDCVVSGSGSQGVRLETGARGELAHTSVTGSGHHGIALNNASVACEACEVAASGAYGVCASNGSSLTMSGCTVADSVGQNVRVEYDSDGELTDTVLTGGYGLVVISGSTASLTRCSVSGSAGTGVSVADSGPVTLTDCVSSDNDSCGVYLQNASGEVRNCTITGNGVHGMYALGNGCVVEVENGLVADNPGCGVGYVTGAHGGVTGVEIAHNGGGVFLGGTDASVTGNNIHANSWYGILIRTCPGQAVHSGAWGGSWTWDLDWAHDDISTTSTISGNTIAGNGGAGIQCEDCAPGNVDTLHADNTFPDSAPNRYRVTMHWWGLVKVLRSGVPIEGAAVQVVGADGSFGYAQTTDADGLALGTSDYHNAITWPKMIEFWVDNDGVLHETTPHTVSAESADGSFRGTCTYAWNGEPKSEGSDIDGRYQIAYVELNAKPIADAGGDRTVEANTTGGANVILDASASSDPDGDELTFTWLEDGEVIAGPTTTEQVTVFLELGMHEITLEAADGHGEPATDSAVITVEDTTPPEFSLQMLESELWPVNHKMVLAGIVSGVTDICDASPDVSILVTSDEPINGRGDGNTEPDWEVVQNGDTWEIWLRAERAGPSDGRLYLITVNATDDSANVATKSAQVLVPRDQGSGKQKGK